MNFSAPLAPSLLMLSLLTPTPQEWEELPSPDVGAVAPELGQVVWRQLPGGAPPEMAKLRGDVVVVHTWVWFCDS